MIGLQDRIMVWSSFEVLCVYDHISTPSVSLKNATIECKVELSKLCGLYCEDMEVWDVGVVLVVERKELWGFMGDCYQI